LRKILDCSSLICSTGTTIQETIRRIDETTPMLFQVILDSEQHVAGTVTDGDIRRAFARGVLLEDMVEACMYTPPVIGRVGEDEQNAGTLRMRRFLPVCDDEGKFDHLLVEHVGPRRAERALIMAGGFGKRLGEMTKSTPKPLIPVAGKPLLEHVLERLEDYGIKQVDISVHYLADQIVQFVDDRENRCEVRIVHENEPLGTAGSLGLLECPVTEPVLVLNADVLTDVDLHALIEHHLHLDCDGTVAASRHEYKLPYGVLNFDAADTLLGIEEKPTYHHLVSAGIYYLDPSIIRLVTPGQPIDIPELFELAIASGLRLTVFPVHEYWSDVGHPTDLENANSFDKNRPNGK
jgi:dTDP-glucose pyrophosphorylase